MIILGLGGLLRDAACAVLRDGEVLAAIEEAKLTRGAAHGAMPQAAIAECLRLSGAAREQVDCVAIARPFARGPESLFHIALRDQFPNSEIVVVEHHAAHAASAYYASPFERATVLTLDHAGDFRCGARWRASGNQLHLEKEWYYPDSLGRLYRAVTELLGFHAGADEHKVQWLSAGGDDRFAAVFRDIVSDAVRLDASYFDGHRLSGGGFSAKFYDRLGLKDGEKIPESMAPSIARGLQKTVEDTVLALAGEGENLALAGGLFYNALLVEFLERSGKWKNVFVQAAAGNAGTALGAVYYVWHQTRRNVERRDSGSLLLGPSYDAEQIKQVLENCKLRFAYLRSTEEMLATVVRLLGEHKIVAWMHGRMEFGPRALGARSILASPLDPYSTENLNVYIKHREPFRKFAASVPAELASEYFETGPNARYLATVGRVRAEHRKTFESAILGHDLVRVHTVSEADNPLYHRLLLEAGKATGLAVLYNTSFNLFGDPLVSTPRDAVRSFYSSGIDALSIGNFLLEK
ncbi:MAG TPA: carbamoyltransferase C-terminal domain-containing protein [Bryobacteraceae bacterium]|nr:carbamoyltransferase C-terminal domain-containing protein [Bryobacteraceae bacterium]